MWEHNKSLSRWPFVLFRGFSETARVRESAARHGTSAAVTFTPSRPCTLTFHFLQLMFSKYCVPDWLWLNRCSATVTSHVTSRLLFSSSPLSSSLLSSPRCFLIRRHLLLRHWYDTDSFTARPQCLPCVFIQREGLGNLDFNALQIAVI